MAELLARYGPVQPGTAASTVITCGAASTFVVVRHLHLVNASAASCWVTIGINGTAAANALWFQVALPAGDFLDWTGNIPLLGGASPDTLQVIAQTASALTLTIGAVSGP